MLANVNFSYTNVHCMFKALWKAVNQLLTNTSDVIPREGTGTSIQLFSHWAVVIKCRKKSRLLSNLVNDKPTIFKGLGMLCLMYLEVI